MTSSRASSSNGPGPWSESAWQAEALAWIDARLADAGLHRVGPPGEPRIRSWATVIAVPTDAGRIWFKAAGPITAHEMRLYPLVVRSAPDIVLTPIAVDTDRAWILLPEGGTSLMHSVRGDALVERLEHVIRRYARLQRALTPELHMLLDSGAVDMRPNRMPAWFDEALAACRQLVPDDPLEQDRYARVAALRPRFASWCQQLGASPVAPSLDHSDLHAINILLSDPGDDATARVYDWGDSVVAHPFASLLVLLRNTMDLLETSPDDPRLAHLRDTYLREFADLAPLPDLIQAADLACRVSIVSRAITWIRVLEQGPPPNPDWATAPWEWMKSLLHDSWLD